MAYAIPPPMVFSVPSAPVPTHLQAAELPSYPSLHPHVGLSCQAPPPIDTTFHEPGTPTHAAQFASPMHFFPEADTEQERRLKRMEETIRALQAGDARPDERYGNCSLFPAMRLPRSSRSRNSRLMRAQRIRATISATTGGICCNIGNTRSLSSTPSKTACRDRPSIGSCH
ncbi:hypothetical protein CRG98_018552 [Punica granatum]|uniref:Uncharacterized protein n=1 Tax=Punica granatum TaxID=22663 RepID=A0A2I0JYZ6_PUNGR|nr:hypothetical protein CRG98_018552 [Punica granatum]